MSEKVGLIVKKPESKGKEHTLAKTKTGFSPSVDMNSPVEQILHLQRTIGNRAVTRLFQSGAIQAKLESGQTNAKYQREANRAVQIIQRENEKNKDNQDKPFSFTIPLKTEYLKILENFGLKNPWPYENLGFNIKLNLEYNSGRLSYKGFEASLKYKF